MSRGIKQKADELIEMFWNNSFTTKYEATEIAILHQERLIEEMEKFIEELNEMSVYITKEIGGQLAIKVELKKVILRELESRL